MSEIWTTLSKGGIMMIPLILTSVVGLAVIIERALVLSRVRIFDPEVTEKLMDVKSANDLAASLENIEEQDNAFLRIVHAALRNRGNTKEEIKEAMIDQGRQEARMMERGLVVLETIAGIAPLMGLLGTVLGMIKVFQVISEQGLGQTQSLSSGISEALITTVIGLFIAIPALIAYNYFNHRVEDLILEIEKHSARLLEKVMN